jgi:CubicO group peptidase (beta-lactamase class C family)
VLRKLTFCYVVIMCLNSLDHIGAQTKKASTVVADRDMGRRLDEYMSHAAEFGFSGALLVAIDDKVVLENGYGWADRSTGMPVTKDTIFGVASITKNFTATAIMQLQAQGKLKTSDPISKYLPAVPADKSGVTIHQLLTHTWGLGSVYAATVDDSKDEVVQKILATPLESMPGEVFRYSDDGYTLLAAIVEAASGIPFERYVQERILEPAGLLNTTFQGERDPRITKRLAHTYNVMTDFGTSADYPMDWADMGSGGLDTTVGDLFRWHLTLEQGKLIPRQMQEEMTRPYVRARGDMDYGYGWFVIHSQRGTTVLYHGGNETPRGITAAFKRYVSEGVVTALCVNVMYQEQGLNRAVQDDIEGILFGGRVTQLPIYDKTVKSDFRKFVGVYGLETGGHLEVKLLNGHLLIGAAGQDAIDLLKPTDSKVRSDLVNMNQETIRLVSDAAKGKFEDVPLRRPWGKLIAQYGDYKSMQLIGTDPTLETGKESATYVRLRFDKGSPVCRLLWSDREPGTLLCGTDLAAYTFLAPTSRTAFVGYDLIAKTETRVKFEKVGSSFRINLDGVTSKATKRLQ